MSSNVIIFAKNFRGFRQLYVDLSKLHFLVGDNSSGKSSALHLVDCVLRSRLNVVPSLRQHFGVDEYDYFSPYFQYSDVTFGWISRSGDDANVKIITVSQQSGGRPQIVKTSFGHNQRIVTLAKYGKSIKARQSNDVNFNYEELLATHENNKGYKKLPRKDGGGIADISNFFSAYVLLNKEEISKRGESSDGGDFFEEMVSFTNSDLPVPIFVAPLRSLPEKYYNADIRMIDSNVNFAPILRDFERSANEVFSQAVRKLGREGDLFDDVHVSKINKTMHDSPLVVTIERGGKKFFINQLGVGLSQFIPILAVTHSALKSPRNVILLIQQPELHLHPVAQAALGSFFKSLSDNGLTFILETHSSFMMDRFRSDMRDHGVDINGDRPPLRILYCANSQDGNAVQCIDCSPIGDLLDAPPAYFQFFMDELVRTMR